MEERAGRMPHDPGAEEERPLEQPVAHAVKDPGANPQVGAQTRSLGDLPQLAVVEKASRRTRYTPRLHATSPVEQRGDRCRRGCRKLDYDPSNQEASPHPPAIAGKIAIVSSG